MMTEADVDMLQQMLVDLGPFRQSFIKTAEGPADYFNVTRTRKFFSMKFDPCAMSSNEKLWRMSGKNNSAILGRASYAIQIATT